MFGFGRWISAAWNVARVRRSCNCFVRIRTMLKKLVKAASLLIAVLVLGVAVFCVVNYVRHDQETSELDDKARQGTSGSYIRLSDGVTHYELAGPEKDRTVVLICGYSVPYYI